MRSTKTSQSFQCQGQLVKFNSNFDSGNLRSVLQLSQQQFLIQTALDSYDMQVSQKSFFHFSVQNYPINNKIQLLIPNLALLQTFLGPPGKEEQDNCLKRYRPWCSLDGIDYQRLNQECVSFEFKNNNQNVSWPVLKLSYQVKSPIVYFSFAVPYSYERYLNMVRDLPQTEQFYLRKQVLSYSLNLNSVYMISITSFDRMTEQEQNIGSSTNGVLFPQKHILDKGKYFDKPVILMSGRVHPGQTTSSWALQGIIKFLISNNQEAMLLRKNFLIIIVPMLNPDGVYEGMYRLDTKGHNLNRYYQISDNRQPSIYGMKHLIKHFQASKRLLYFFDFHGHPSLKGSFIYGNAHDDIAFQAQTELFSRILSLKCKTFQQKLCVFDRDQMKSKDRFDFFTKQGCARVYAFKMAGILHSYTIQMGFHSVNKFSSVEQPQKFFYEQKDYMEEGICILKTVLQTSGLINQFPKSSLRRKLATQIDLREDRFRKQARNVNLKKKNVNQIIQVQYWKSIKDKFFKEKKQKQDQCSIKQKTNFVKQNLKTFYNKTVNPEDRFEEGTDTQIKLSEKYSEQQLICMGIIRKKEEQKYHKSTLQFCLDKVKKVDTNNITINFKNRKMSDKRLSNVEEKRKIYFKFFNKDQSQKISVLKQMRDTESRMKSIQPLTQSRIRIIRNQRSLKSKKAGCNSLDKKNITRRQQEGLFNDLKMRDQQKYQTENKINKKNQFAIVSDTNVNINIQQFKEVFKKQYKKKYQIENKRSLKVRNPFSTLK